MGRVVVIGPSARVSAYALAGALVETADDDAEVLRAWEGLGEDVELVVLAPEAARALRVVGRPEGRLVVEMEP